MDNHTASSPNDRFNKMGNDADDTAGPFDPEQGRMDYLEAEIDALRKRMQLLESRLNDVDNTKRHATKHPTKSGAKKQSKQSKSRTASSNRVATFPRTASPRPGAKQYVSDGEAESPENRRRRKRRKVRKKLYRGYAAVVGAVIVGVTILMLSNIFKGLSPALPSENGIDPNLNDDSVIEIDIIDNP